jgi:hypothetical protein
MNTYLSKITLKVLNIKESQIFYDFVFKFIPLEKKEEIFNDIFYWSSFGLRLSQQDDIVHMTPGLKRIGVIEYSVFISDKNIVEEIYQKLKVENYRVVDVLKRYDYSPGYYSFKVMDPDENVVEFYTTD